MRFIKDKYLALAPRMEYLSWVQAFALRAMAPLLWSRRS